MVGILVDEGDGLVYLGIVAPGNIDEYVPIARAIAGQLEFESNSQ